MRKGKTIYKEESDNTIIKSSTEDSLEPISITLQHINWITPLNEMESYDRLVRRINKAIRQYLYDNLNGTIFNNKIFIVDIDVATNFIKYNKPSYMRLEITLYQNHPLRPYNDENLLKELKHISNGIIQLTHSRGDFIYRKSKKEILKIISTLNI